MIQACSSLRALPRCCFQSWIPICILQQGDQFSVMLAILAHFPESAKSSDESWSQSGSTCRSAFRLLSSSWGLRSCFFVLQDGGKNNSRGAFVQKDISSPFLGICSKIHEKTTDQKSYSDDLSASSSNSSLRPWAAAPSVPLTAALLSSIKK